MGITATRHARRQPRTPIRCAKHTTLLARLPRVLPGPAQSLVAPTPTNTQTLSPRHRATLLRMPSRRPGPSTAKALAPLSVLGSSSLTATFLPAPPAVSHSALGLCSSRLLHSR